MTRKVRLDLHLLTKGIVSSRQQANQLIRAGKVRSIHGEILDKPGYEINDNFEVLVTNPPRFVSRGGEKIIAAFDAFSLSVTGRVCLDCGISTGGFTDCLLQQGASMVYGIDVGYGQTSWKLRNDKRVVLKERTNIRNLSKKNLYEGKDLYANFAVADLSFISLRIVLPAITNLLIGNDKEALFLVKPQFEVGKERVGKGGVVKKPEAHVDALNGVINSAISEGWKTKGLIASPLTGPAGNHEYLLWLGSGKSIPLPDLYELVIDTLS